ALGRRWVGPQLGAFAARHPQLNLRLSLSDRVVDMLDNAIDLAVRIGAQPDSRLVSRRLAGNRRLICAAPGYLQRHGTPRVPQDLLQHQCLILQRAGMPLQSWSFQTERGLESIRVQGRLSADSGEQLADWARAGLGLAIKSSWDVVEDLASGSLVTVLDDFCGPEMDIHLVYPTRQFVPNRLRLLIDFLLERFAQAEAEQQRPTH
ncbi:MAG: substrate binding domain-containing protein, partial [Pseudomonas sp.]